MKEDESIIILDGLDFLWKVNDINEVVALHNKGHHIYEISKRVKRDPTEVLLALIHVAVEREVDIRPL